MKRSLTILACAILALAIFAVPASAAKKGFKTGIYKATGAVSFNFKIYKGTCYHKGKKRAGYCISGRGDRPKLQMKCPVIEGGVRDHEGFAFIPDQFWIPKSGKVRIKRSNPIRTDEEDRFTFNLTLKKNGRATGNLSLTSDVKSISVKSTCESGVQKFSAKR